MCVVDYCMLVSRSSVSVCTCVRHLRVFIKYSKEVPCLRVPGSSVQPHPDANRDSYIYIYIYIYI